MKKPIVLAALALSIQAHSQTTLFQDDFEQGLANWDMNTTGSGENRWIINATYTGSVSASIANTPAQPGSFTGGPNSFYLHVYNYPNCFGFVPVTCNANFDPNMASDQYAAMANSIATTGQSSVTLSFWYLCAGEENVSFGSIEYSTNNGATWIPTGSALFGVTTWTPIALTDPAFDNQANLQFRFRWQNGASGSNPPFSIDELTITGNAQTGSETITMQHLNADTYCAGDPDFIGFEALGTYNASNFFTAQLSDAAGSFASPTDIGTLSSTATGILSMSVTYPVGTPAGTGYRVRVIASDPATIGTDNGTDVTIHSLPSVSVQANPANGEVCAGESVIMTASGAATYAWAPAGSLDTATGAIVTATPAQTTVYTVNGTDANGCSNAMDFTVTIDDCTGISEHTSALFGLYPNPATDVVHLQYATALNVSAIELLDQGGRVVRTVKTTATSIDISDLGPGTYFVRITHANGSEIARITKR